MSGKSSLSADVAVIGAGAMGGWAALYLQEAGVSTLLVDAWGAGNHLSSSGGESRILRTAYGPLGLYTRWAWAARQEWMRRQQDWGVPLFSSCGMLWIGKAGHPDIEASRGHLAALKIPFEILSASQAAERFPLLRMAEDEQALLEPLCGALQARRACERVLRAFLDAGGAYETALVGPPRSGDGRGVAQVNLIDGRRIEAERFLFACGPWLPGLFPELLGPHIRISRQEVIFFDQPSDGNLLSKGDLPAWYDFTWQGFYGIPPLQGKGLKLASDLDGPPFDPTGGDRTLTQQTLSEARQYLGRRLPNCRDLPLIEFRVCQYERTPDRHLILDRHPDYENVFLAGGGSGHGFKLGPVAGRIAANLTIGNEDQAPYEVRLDRLA